MKKRVVIIGSGLGGLSSGVILARNGYDVTVLEQGAQIGGCLQCFVRHGAKFETGMHFIGSADEGQILHKMMRYLGIYDKLCLERLDPLRYNVVSLRGQCFNFANGKESFIEQMASYFPGQRENLARYCRLIDKIAAASSLRSLKYSRTDNAVNAEYQLRPVNQVLEEMITDPLLRNVLAGDLSLYAAEWDKTPFAVHAFIMDFYNQSAFRFVGGSDSVAKALHDVLVENGGEVHTRAKATRIACDDVRALGVEADGGRFFPADYVISAVHPMRTLEMLEGTRLIRPSFIHRIKDMPQTVGCFSVYLQFKENEVPYMNYNFFGYDAETPWNCERYDDCEWPKGYLYMHMCDTLGQRYARSGVILSYMRISDLEQWKDTRVGHRGCAYEAYVREHAMRLIRSVSRQFPGLEDSVESFYISTPLTYRDYTGTEGGSIYGVAKDVSSGSAGHVPHRTRIPNVFMTGQNINSHGMLGVLVGSMVTCSEFLTPQFLYNQILESNR